MADIDDVMRKLEGMDKCLRQYTEAAVEVRTRLDTWEVLCKQKHERVDENLSRVEHNLDELPSRVERLEDTVKGWKWYIRVTFGALISSIIAAFWATWEFVKEGR